MVIVKDTNENSQRRHFYRDDLMSDAYDQRSAPEWTRSEKYDGLRTARFQRDVAERLVSEYPDLEIVEDSGGDEDEAVTTDADTDERETADASEMTEVQSGESVADTEASDAAAHESEDAQAEENGDTVSEAADSDSDADSVSDSDDDSGDGEEPGPARHNRSD